MSGADATMDAVTLDWVDAQTPFGNAEATAQALVREEVALRLTPFLSRGAESPDRVPLALFQPLAERAPPRGWELLEQFLDTIPEGPWGSGSHPVIVASSNFGVGSLLEFKRDGDPAHLPFATPHDSIDRIRETGGWGFDVTVISHACVSAQLALREATRRLELGARRVLVFAFDLLSDFVTGGFYALKILNGYPPAPYMDRAFGAIGLGDGLAAAVLSRDPNEPWRLGAQRTWNEMYHMTSNDPSGAGFDALLGPLASAVGRRRVWIKGHGTGTLDIGRLEVAGSARYFPEAPLVSWKGSLGHTLGSCALVELAVAMAAMDGGEIPGTVHGAEEAPPMGPQVAEKSFSADGFEGFVLLSNAFGGAHAGALVYHA